MYIAGEGQIRENSQITTKWKGLKLLHNDNTQAPTNVKLYPPELDPFLNYYLAFCFGDHGQQLLQYIIYKYVGALIRLFFALEF